MSVLPVFSDFFEDTGVFFPKTDSVADGFRWLSFVQVCQ